MKEWIMSIVGAIVLTFLIDVIMSDGEMKKYVKGITSLIVLAIIVAPLPNFFTNENNGYHYLDDDNNTVEALETGVNYVFLEETRQKQVDNLNKVCLTLLNEKGIANVKITPQFNKVERENKIEKILIDCTNLVIKEGYENINIKDTIASIVAKVYKVKNDIVEVTE